MPPLARHSHEIAVENEHVFAFIDDRGRLSSHGRIDRPCSRERGKLFAEVRVSGRDAIK
ncbi:MAG: hypothetical protein ACREUZ_15755 [Burkholderiales bacterium]